MYKSLIIDDKKAVRIAISKLGKWGYYHIRPPETASNGSKEFLNCKFIVASGYDSFSYVHQALLCGAIDYLLTPIEEQSLNAAIEKALSQLAPDKDLSVGTNTMIELSQNDIDQNIRE